MDNHITMFFSEQNYNFKQIKKRTYFFTRLMRRLFQLLSFVFIVSLVISCGTTAKSSASRSLGNYRAVSVALQPRKPLDTINQDNNDEEFCRTVPCDGTA